MNKGVDVSEPLTWPLVWVDLEMTGLDPEREVIVEIAVIVDISKGWVCPEANICYPEGSVAFLLYVSGSG